MEHFVISGLIFRQSGKSESSAILDTSCNVESMVSDFRELILHSVHNVILLHVIGLCFSGIRFGVIRNCNC